MSDVVLMVDSSESIMPETYVQIQKFVKAFATKFAIGSARNHTQIACTLKHFLMILLNYKIAFV
jgi:hypothetical protein